MAARLMPVPKSVTDRRTRPSRCPAATTTSVPGGGVAQRVVDEDTHDLRHPLRVAVGLGDGRGEAQLEVRFVGRERRRELGRDPAGDLAQVRALGAQLERAGLELGEVEQVGREPAEPGDLLADLADEHHPRLLVELLVLEQLEEPADREDRRAQLVRGRRDEAAARGLELGELALHPVERPREPAELVAGGDVEARGEVALGDPAARRAPSASRGARPSSRRARWRGSRAPARSPPATRIRCRMSSTPRWMPSSCCENTAT